LEPANRGKWHAWLTRNADSAASIWLAIGKRGDTVTTLAYEQAIEAALCFGWIDSIERKLDDARYGQLFSRRKPVGTWSRINKERVARLAAERKMAPTGFATIELAKQNGNWNTLDPDLRAEHCPPADRETRLDRARELRGLRAIGAEDVPELDRQCEAR
jgi:uncharacterized protein YdeI (YjbR/CyaY-like superfamily)